MSELIPVLTQRASDYSSALVHITELRLALLDAIRGRLSTFLIRHDQMTAAMRGIAAELGSTVPNLHLATRTTGEAYQLTDILVSRVGRDVYLTIKFLLTPVTEIFTLYNVLIFPVLMPDASPHQTQLDSDIRDFAYEPTADYYVEFRSYPVVKHRMLYMSGVTDTFRHISDYSCIVEMPRNAFQ